MRVPLSLFVFLWAVGCESLSAVAAEGAVNSESCEFLCKDTRARLIAGSVLTQAEKDLVMTCAGNVQSDLVDHSRVSPGIRLFSIDRNRPKDLSLIASLSEKATQCAKLRSEQKTSK